MTFLEPVEEHTEAPRPSIPLPTPEESDRSFGVERVSYTTHEVYGDIAAFTPPDLISDMVCRGEVWEETLLKHMAGAHEPGTVYMDIGGNMGFTAAGFLAMRPDTPCLFFEPVPLFSAMAQYNLKKFPRVRFFSMALGSQPAQLLSFATGYNNCGFTVLQNPDRNQTDILSTSLDTLQEAGVFKDRIGLVKLDVEGHEAEVLRGAKNFLRVHRPPILVEIWGGNYEEVTALLREAGYSLSKGLSAENYLFEFSSEVQTDN